MSLNKKLAKVLSNLENSKITSNGKEIAVRCPFCKDSIKSNTPHMYIGIKDNVYLYDCKRCPASGILDDKTLIKLKISDSLVIDWIIKYNSKILSSKYTGQIKDKTSIPYILQNYTIEEKEKVEYLKQRTNIDFSKKSNIDKYKIILSLKKYMNDNDIKMNQIDHERSYIDMIDKHFLGFLCSDNKSAIFRNVTARNYNKRYLNFKFNRNSSRMIYILNNDIDLMTPNPIISLSEGPFDIINIHNSYFKDRDNSDTIFGAVGTKKGFKQGLIECLKITGFFGSKVNIFSNDEVDLNEYKRAFSLFKNSFKYSVYYNDNNEDFGDISLGFDPISFDIRP